jgi:hypothetical protein
MRENETKQFYIGFLKKGFFGKFLFLLFNKPSKQKCTFKGEFETFEIYQWFR